MSTENSSCPFTEPRTLELRCFDVLIVLSDLLKKGGTARIC